MKSRAFWLFWFQVVMAWVLAVPQIVSLLHDKTEGLTLTLYVLYEVYLVVSLLLSIESWRANKEDKNRWRTIFIMGQWIFLVGVIFFCGVGRIPWTLADTVVCCLAGVLSVFSIIHYGGLKDPFAKGWIAVCCKALPQLWISYHMLAVGGAAGFPLITLIAGYATAIPRWLQIESAGKSGGWDRPTKGLRLGELSNVLTCIVMNVVWVYVSIT